MCHQVSRWEPSLALALSGTTHRPCPHRAGRTAMGGCLVLVPPSLVSPKPWHPQAVPGLRGGAAFLSALNKLDFL